MRNPMSRAHITLVLAVSFTLTTSVLVPVTAHGGDESLEDKNICGPLALAAAADLIGKRELFTEVFRLLPPGKGPGTLEDLRVTSEKLGLHSRAVRWDRDSDIDLSCPAIIHLDAPKGKAIGHFVLLVKADQRRFLVLDPVQPAVWVSSADIWQLWDGVALHVAATETALPDPTGSFYELLRACIAVLTGTATVGVLLFKCQ